VQPDCSSEQDELPTPEGESSVVTAAPPYVPPRIASWPEYDDDSFGREAIDLAARAGLKLDPWQEFMLIHGCGRNDGRWAAFEVGCVVPRQNGKGAIEEARELASLFLLKDQFVIHSAHQFDTSLEAFRRLLSYIEDTPELERQIKQIRRSHGEEGVELTNGNRIRYRTRTKGGGRGFSCDLLILDEAMFLPDMAMGALLPTLSARPDPQVWYGGSAVDQLVHEHGVVLARLRERGQEGNDPSLVYAEWSLDFDNPSEITDDLAVDQTLWRESNPALDIRIRPEHIAHEQRSVERRIFAVERLNVGDWPRTDEVTVTMIPLEQWDELADPNSVLLNPVCLAYDISPERKASIAAAGRNADGQWHVEVIAQKNGTGWIPDALSRYVDDHEPHMVVCDTFGPSGSMMHAVEEAGVLIEGMTASEHGQACGLLLDAVNEKTLRHLGSADLRNAIKGAATRPLGDAWAWSRKDSNVDISPLVSSTLALWAAMQMPEGGGPIEIW